MKKRRPRPCKLCGERPATVPDRESPTPVFRPAICADCHARRLAGDLAGILRAQQSKG